MPLPHPSAVILLVLATLAVPWPSLAEACAGVRLPTEVETAGVALRLNGAGMRSVSFAFFHLEIYVAALYLEQPASEASQVLEAPATSRLVLHFLRDTPRERLTDGFSEAFERAAPGDASFEVRLERLNGWMQDMASGSELVFDYAPGDGLVVTAAGERRGSVPGADFARILLGNWLGPFAVDPRVEAGLLGGACG